MMSRSARCHCGQLELRVTEEELIRRLALRPQCPEPEVHRIKDRRRLSSGMRRWRMAVGATEG
jgi:hypothetical protein